ncbi:MAG TPA: hypothetical protein VES89_04855, partial [Candidatus Competibacteraceae bacterium]|nr:hypothetical protein [Candidatus Competibacteraceae bacterium]
TGRPIVLAPQVTAQAGNPTEHDGQRRRRHRRRPAVNGDVDGLPFGEDAGRTRKDHSAENLALRRRMALNRLRRNGPPRDRIRRRQRRAALNEDYRSRLLWGVPTPATT